MQITNRQQPFQKTHAKKRPLANPFGNLNVQSSPPQNDFESLDNNDQNAYGNMTYSPDRTTTTSSFSQDYATNYNNGGEYEQQNSVSFNDSYQQNTNTRSVGMRNQSNYSTGPTEDFEGFAPGVQALQAPVVKANSVLGTVFGFASMFMGGNGTQGSNGRQTMNEYDEENEPPLLEDLGIDLKLIKMRALSVLKFQKCSEEFVKEADMSGPLLLFLTLGSLLLLSGKVHFGYIYGFGVIGTVAVYMMMNLISQVYKVQLYNTMSILGYCLFPVVVLAFFNIFFNLVNLIGLVLSAGAVIWATLAATNFFQVLLNLDQQKWLIAYPILLFYKVFVIITIF